MSDDYTVQINPILPDGTMLNLRAATTAQAEELFSWAAQNAQNIVKTIEAFKGVSNAAAGGLTGTVTHQGAPQQQAPATSPQGNAPVCSHGQMKLVPGGFSKRTQAPYDAFWACQGPRESQCKSQKAA